jgi:hypothetical protein
MTINANSYVVEWSPTQRCFYIATVKEMLECNHRIFRGINAGGGYLALAFAETHDEARAIAHRLEQPSEQQG